jgi:hypothetical protein
VTLPWAVAAFAFAALIVVVPGAWLLRQRSNVPTALVQAPAGLATPAALFLESSRAYHSDAGDLWFVDGKIRNITNAPLSNVEAVATWLDRDGLIVATDGDLIEFKRLMPGESSKFRTITRMRPGMLKFELRFRYEDGKPLALRDDGHAASGEVPPPTPVRPPEPSTPDGEIPSPQSTAVPASLR